MNLTNEFLAWLFEHSWKAKPRYQRADRQAEYGMSESEFLEGHYGEAIEDARDVWSDMSPDERLVKVKQWREELQRVIDLNTELLKQDWFRDGLITSPI